MSSSCNGQECKSWLTEACETFPSLEREGDRRTSVESRIHYVNQKEWRQYVTLLLQNYEIFDFHTIDSPVFSGGWWKVECCMLEHRKACWCAPPSEIWSSAENLSGFCVWYPALCRRSDEIRSSDSVPGRAGWMNQGGLSFGTGISGKVSLSQSIVLRSGGCIIDIIVHWHLNLTAFACGVEPSVIYRPVPTGSAGI